MSADRQHLEIAKIQNEIESYLGLRSTQMIFDFQEGSNSGIRLDVITVNPRHNQSFLFHTTKGYDKIDALQQMLVYVKEHRDKKNSYTIQWSLAGENELHTSYFRAKDIVEAIDKLHYGRDPNGVTIFSVVLNPLS
jgi:predicted ATP-grasp superfamily ATP-dependent carboligase